MFSFCGFYCDQHVSIEASSLDDLLFKIGKFINEEVCFEWYEDKEALREALHSVDLPIDLMYYPGDNYEIDIDMSKLDRAPSMNSIPGFVFYKQATDQLLELLELLDENHNEQFSVLHIIQTLN